MASGDVIVLSVGSLNCYVGIVKEDMFAVKDEIPLPRQSLHVLARRVQNDNNNMELQHDIPPMDKTRMDIVQQTRRRMGMKVPNKANRVSVMPRKERDVKKIRKDPADILIGTEAKNMENDPSYEVIWPIKKGRLNIGKDGRTPGAIQADLNVLWTKIIESHCFIEASAFSKYRVMLLVPDQFIRKHVIIMIKALMDDMGFSAVFIHQESVCAAFGAGVSTACVIDIGHEKVSVSCIDEGVSINRSRAFFDYGGQDVQELLDFLIANSSFYSMNDGDDNNITQDALTGQHGVQTIKESFCHLDFEDSSRKRFDLVLKQQQSEIVKVFSLTLHDELLLAPLGLFFLEMITPVEEGKYFEKNADYNDPYDCLDPPTYVEMGGTLGRYAEKGPKDKVSSIIESCDRLSIDEAVVASVRQVGHPDLYSKLLSSIIVCGGCAKIPYLGKFLVEMILSRIQDITELERCKVDLLSLPRNSNASYLSWRGAAIVATTPVVQECWVTQEEWKAEGSTKIREKVCFRW